MTENLKGSCKQGIPSPDHTFTTSNHALKKGYNYVHGHLVELGQKSWKLEPQHTQGQETLSPFREEGRHDQKQHNQVPGTNQLH